MADVQILTADSGDWIGVYKGDALVYEGHSIDPRELLERIEVIHDFRRMDFEAEGWDRCPPTFPEPERGI